MFLRTLLLCCLFFVISSMAEPLSREKTEAHAKNIDRLIEQKLFENKLTYTPRVGDDIYVRRIYLDIIGRIPTWREAQDFILSPRSDKYYRVVENLFKSPAYASHNFNYWADILRAVNRVDGGASGTSYIQWIKKSLEENKPYDKMVYELLSAEGSPYERGNGAVGYYLRDPGMPLDNMANTMQIFLGTSIGCAQCHDHPFAQWSQMDFYKLAAFTGGIKTRQNNPKSGMVKKLVKNEDDKVKQQINRFLRNLNYGVEGTGTGMMKLPDNYAYNDASPNDLVEASVPFGKQIKLHASLPTKSVDTSKKKKSPKIPEINSRHHFAQWVTDKENPRFTKVVANRMWKKVMGLGLIEPVDDMTEKTKASHPALMDYLTKLMIEVKYDLREFQKVLTQTRAYNSEARELPLKPNEKYFYDGPIVHRLKSEQVWDSLIGLVVPEVDNRKAIEKDESKAYYELKYKTAEEIVQSTKDEFVRRDKLKENQEKYIKFKRSIDRRKKELSQKLKTVRKKKDKVLEKKILRELEYLNARIKKAKNFVDQFKAPKDKKKKPTSDRLYAGYSRELLRASELPSPAKAGHFLRQFGQSERQTIQAGSQDANVTQVLNLLNGFVDKNLINNKKAILLEELSYTSTPEQKLKIIFLSLFSRYPATRESSMMLKHVDRSTDKEKAWKDILWAMINTNEFMFRR